MNGPSDFSASSDRPGAPSGYVEVHLPDLSGRGGPGEFMLVSVPPGTYPDSVREDAAWWWRTRELEEDPDRLRELLDLGPPVERKPRTRVRLVLGCHPSETSPMVEITLFAVPAGGHRVCRRWTQECTRARAPRVYADFKKSARRWARAAGLAVTGTSEQSGLLGPRRSDTF